ncbi:MAG TPA: histidine kinase [Thermoanaerobaculia bacterium]|nr:histidine kinase [Thermoanaerobaculia bacterium]
MTTRERYAITAGIVMVLLVSRFVVIAAMVAIGSPWRAQSIVFWLISLGGLVLALPLAIVTIDRGTDRALPMLLLNVAHGLVFGLISAAATGVVRAIRWYRAALDADTRTARLEAEQARQTREVIEHRLRPRTTVALLERIAEVVASDRPRAESLLFRLARHERMLLGRGAERQSLEDELRTLRSALALEHAGIAIAIRGSATRPAASAARAFVAAIENAALAVQPVSLSIETAAVEHGVRVRVTANAAFRERFSFDGARVESDGSLAIELPFEPARAVAAAPADPPPPRMAAVVPIVLAYIAICIFLDRGRIGWEEWRMLGTASLISVALWIAAAPLLDRAIARVVTLRFAMSAALATACILLAALAVTLASCVVLAIASDRPVRALLELGMVVSQNYGRNLLLALTVGATSFAMAFTRVLLAAHAAAARLLDEQVQAETRELEARFHPHFLLNALTSIAALVRMDARAAALACRRLAELVERTAGCAGEKYWTVGQELDLVSDYVAVQRMRFQERLSVAEWDVGSVARPTRFPRLVLQPLVENVFKHAVARSPRTTRVGLSMRRSRHTLRLTIWNDAASALIPDRLGRGLAFVIRRVRAAGGEVTIEAPEGARFRVRCSIPIGAPALWRTPASHINTGC